MLTTVPNTGTLVNKAATGKGEQAEHAAPKPCRAMTPTPPNSFSARDTLRVCSHEYGYFRLAALGERYDLATLPYSLKILLENLLRFEDGRSVRRDDIEALASWRPGTPSSKEIAYRPARVLLQDFTGVPCVVDLAAMRDAIAEFGGDPKRINPLQPVELVIDHSVQVDAWATPEAFEQNAELEFARNGERYAFLKWGQSSLDGFRAVPPDTGIVHQVNIEYLARVVFGAGGAGEGHPSGTTLAYPDTVVGTDSHTTMANGLGVLAWGVGGIEAEAAMLGQPVTMLIPDVIGFKLTGKLREGVTATDLALQITQMLRKKGVVGKFVEFYGTGLSQLPVADRTVIGNMSPEYGSTVAIFPLDALSLAYLRLTGRAPEQIALVEAYAKAQGMFRTDESPEPRFSDTLTLDLDEVVPNLAGPRRPQDRVPLSDVKSTFNDALEGWRAARAGLRRRGRHRRDHVVYEHLEPGLAARRRAARQAGRREGPHDGAVGENLARAWFESRHRLSAQGRPHAVSRPARLQPGRLRLHDLHRQQRAARRGRRARGRRARHDRRRGAQRQPQLRGPHSPAGARELSRIAAAVSDQLFKTRYADVFAGDHRWSSMNVPAGERYAWDAKSEYVKRPPYFDGMPKAPPAGTFIDDQRWSPANTSA